MFSSRQSQRTIQTLLCAFFLALAVSTPATAGLAVNVPVVGRVVGAGNVLFATSIDVTNNAQTAMPVTFYFDGTDSATQQTISIVGTIGDFGIVPFNTGRMSANTNRHFDDFIDALVQSGQLSQTAKEDGILGSVLFVFESSSKRGQGTVSARFYNSYAGGLVGVAIKGHEIAAGEPQRLIATLRDTSTNSTGQTYPNLFVNHTGLAPDGSPASSTITVTVSAVSGRTGQPVGNTNTYSIGSGQVLNLGHTFQGLGVDITKEDTIIVTVAVTSGTAAIEGLVSQVDAVTKDGSAFEMSRADF
jgi:hypothetical protein